MKRIILTNAQMDHALGLDRPRERKIWTKEILTDLSDEPQPEWCEVCADLDVNQVPARGTETVNGIRVCTDCAAEYELMRFYLSRSNG